MIHTDLINTYLKTVSLVCALGENFSIVLGKKYKSIHIFEQVWISAQIAILFMNRNYIYIVALAIHLCMLWLITNFDLHFSEFSKGILGEHDHNV